MVPTRLSLVLLAFLATGLSVQAEHGEPIVHHYLAGQTPAPLGIWEYPSPLGLYCAGDEPLVPQGDPDDYTHPLEWLFSGDPQCAPGQALFGSAEPHGLFFLVERSYYSSMDLPGRDTPRDHRGELAVYTLTDDMDGAAVPYHAQLLGNYPTILFEAEGCGGFSFVVPWETEIGPWLNEDYQDTWVWIENVRVTETLALCVGTTGTMRVDYLA